VASYVTPKVEFSTDPLSDTTPAWTDITQYVQEMNWFSGKQKDTDQPEAGGASFVLKNTNRQFEPEYAAGRFYPNIVPGRRFRITLTSGGTNYAQGVFYAREWKLDYPDRGATYSTVTVSCTDGFWRLSQKSVPIPSPLNAESYADVVASDNPIAYYRLAETSGSKFTGDQGPEGQFKAGVPGLGATNPVLGDPNGAAFFPRSSGIYGRAPASDVNVFRDAQACTIEAVVTVSANRNNIAGFGFVTADSAFQFELDTLQFLADTTGTVSGGASSGTHHLCGTWDGSALSFYQDGSLISTKPCNLSQVPASDANEYFYIAGGHGSSPPQDLTVSHVAFYDYALPPARIAAHSDAALNKGYAAATVGTRVAALATDPLWSTAGIPAGTVTVAAEFQHGQAAIDLLNDAVSAEAPGSMFYFNDAANPAYESLEDTWVSAATFGDGATEVDYDQIDLAYDDDLSNVANVGGDFVVGASAQNSQSILDYGTRGVDQTSLPIVKQIDAQLLAQTYVDYFATPQFRVESISLNGADAQQRLQILTREVGDTIRVRRRGDGGTPIDIVTRILRKEKSLDVHGDLRCTWSLARGFNASVSGWRVGVAGFSEVGQTTVAG
jgi:hypothetical protein